MSDDDFFDEDAFFELMGNPVRRKILTTLSSGPMSIKELGDLIDVSRQAILKQLKDLEEKGMVKSEPVEKEPGRKGPNPFIYAIKEFYTMHFEMNPSFAQPRVTRLRFLVGDSAPAMAERASTGARDMARFLVKLHDVDSEIRRLTNDLHEKHANKNAIVLAVREAIEACDVNDEEKQVLYLLARHPDMAVNGFHASDLLNMISFRRDIIKLVMKNLVEAGILVQRDDGKYAVP